MDRDMETRRKRRRRGEKRTTEERGRMEGRWKTGGEGTGGEINPPLPPFVNQPSPG